MATKKKDALDRMIDEFTIKCNEERQRVRRGEQPTMEPQNWHGKDPKTGNYSEVLAQKDFAEYADGFEDLLPTANWEYEQSDRQPPYPGAWSPDLEKPRFVVCYLNKDGLAEWNGQGEETYEEAYGAIGSAMNEGATQIKRIECRGQDWPPISGWGPKQQAERRHALCYYAVGHARDLPNEEEIHQIRLVELGLRGHFAGVVESMLKVHELGGSGPEATKLLEAVAEDDGLPVGHSAREWARQILSEK